MDKGKIKKLELSDKVDAENIIDLESMEEIDLDEEIVLIIPNNSSAKHIIKVRDFIRFNLDKELYINPYTRTSVEFNEADSKLLSNYINKEINYIKSLPNQVFLKIIKTLKQIIEFKIEMLYFPYISKILNIFLGVLPVFKRADEAFGNYEPEISEFNSKLERELEESFNAIELDLLNNEKIKEFQLKEECLLIPYDIKDIITHIFIKLIQFMEKMCEFKKELEYSNKILDILLDLNQVRSNFENFGSIILKNEELLNTAYDVLIKINADMEKLELNLV